MDPYETQLLLERIGEWRQKAITEDDPFDQFLSTYVAFNVFYSLLWKTKYPDRAQDRGDSKKVLETLKLLNGSEDFSQAIEPLLDEYLEIIPAFREEFWPHEGSLKRVPLAESLARAKDNGEAKKTVELLLKWLYKIRCNLVHGEKDYDNTAQQRLLEASAVLLDRLLQLFIARYHQRFMG